MKKNGANQKTTQASVTYDARDLLGKINGGVASKHRLFENQLKRLGQKENKTLRLVSINKNSLIYENVETNTYYEATVTKHKGNRYAIKDAKRIIVTESAKSDDFSSFCKDLVEAVADDNFNRAGRIFDKIESSRFRPEVIPASGVVRTKDGNVHKIRVDNALLPEDKMSKLIMRVSELISENHEIGSDGNIVTAIIAEDDTAVQWPVNEYTRRRVIARDMKNIASNAWKDSSFQKFVKNVSSLVSKGKLNEAVKKAKVFLEEYQEFCLLSEDETAELVDNTLASVNCMNGIIADHVSKLLYKTNVKANKNDIIEAWERTADKTGDPAFSHEVMTLKESSSFEKDYQTFLDKVLNERVDNDMYMMSLKFAEKILSNNGDAADTEFLDQVKDYQARLAQIDSADDALRDEIESLMAGVSHELLNRADDLSSFDEIPGGEDEDELVAPEGAIEGEGEEDLGDEDMDFDIGGEEDDEFADDFADEEGGEEDIDIGGEEDDFGDEEEIEFESKNKSKKSISESKTVSAKLMREAKSAKAAKDIKAALEKHYKFVTENWDKFLAEEGIDGGMGQIEAAIASAEKIAEKGAVLRANYEELQAEIEAFATGGELGAPMPGAEPEMDMGDDSEYAVATGDDMDIDSDYTGELGGEEEGGDIEDIVDDGEGDDVEGGDEIPFGGDDEAGDDDGEDEDGDDDGESGPPDFGGDDDDDGDDDSDDDAGSESDDDDDDDDDDDLDEDQYKHPTKRHGQGKRSGLGRSSINAVEESVVENFGYKGFLAEDGNFYLEGPGGNRISIGSGKGEFDFELGSEESFVTEGKNWLTSMLADKNSAKTAFDSAMIANMSKSLTEEEDLDEGELPDFIKKKMDEKNGKDEDKDDDKGEDEKDDQLDETHTDGMSTTKNDLGGAEGKVGGDERMDDLQGSGGVEKKSVSKTDAKSSASPSSGDSHETEMDQDGKGIQSESKCPICDSTDVTISESEGKCGKCGVVGKASQFVIESEDEDCEEMDEEQEDKEELDEDFVDPKNANYTSKKDADSWGDGKKKNKKESVKQDDESGSKGAPNVASSKKPSVSDSGVKGEKGVGKYKWGKK